MESTEQTIRSKEVHEIAERYASGLCESLKHLNAVHWTRLKEAGIEPVEPFLQPQQNWVAFYWAMVDTLEDRFSLLVDEWCLSIGGKAFSIKARR